MIVARSLVVLGLIGCSATTAAEVHWWKTPDQRGAELLQSGDAAGASEVFRDSRWRGISHFRNGNFAEAQQEFAGVSDPASLYNEGTAAARARDYQTALEKLEQVVQADSTNEDARHNLDIVRQLLEQQESSGESNEGGEQQGDNQESSDQNGQSGSEQSQSDAGDQPGQQEQAQQGRDPQEQGQQQDDPQQAGDAQNGESSTNEQQSAERGGELSADAEDAKSAESQQNQTSSLEPTSEQSEPDSPEQQQAGGVKEQAGPESADDAEQPAGFSQPQPISESEQATEQWMRRIPDDPSQLLRNKIKLNHMIQHENVTDLPEPW